ncbi:MAG: hypothetical protein CM1200mP29_00600 [Verrucomicrobiota bacterium]|nr:MAG: hypothetical protein CM1200mP29_00600 [Verrucomicrobiota bacterium]
MFAARAERVRPHLDDKILSSWNGLMLGATARPAVVLSEPKYLKGRRGESRLFQRELWEGRKGGTLYHRWREANVMTYSCSTPTPSC